MFSGGGMELVSNRGVLDREGEGWMLELGVVVVKDLLGEISIVLVMDFVMVMNLVLFSLSSILKVYGDLMVATSRY